MTHTYSLQQFELIDGLLSVVLNRPQIEDVLPLGREVAVEKFFRPEWELLDALVQILGHSAVDEFASAEECAADFVIRCLSSATLVEAA